MQIIEEKCYFLQKLLLQLNEFIHMNGLEFLTDIESRAQMVIFYVITLSRAHLIFMQPIILKIFGQKRFFSLFMIFILPLFGLWPDPDWKKILGERCSESSGLQNV